MTEHITLDPDSVYEHIGRIAWEQVHDHGAYARDFPTSDYYLTVGKNLVKAITDAFTVKETITKRTDVERV